MSENDAVERVRLYLAQRDMMGDLGDRVHECNGGDGAGGVTLWLDDLHDLVDALTRVEKWAAGMERDFEGNPSHYGKAIATEVRNRITGKSS